jgi:autotransporter passenger strand-loop-strand repeat protein
MTDYYVSSGVISSGVTLTGGSINVLSGGATQSITLGSAGFEYVDAGGEASDTVVLSGGYENIRSGAVGTGTVVSFGGYEWVDGLTIGVTVSSGGIEVVRSGGVASNTVVSSGGSAMVSAGGLASETIIEGGQLFLLSGGTASGSITFGTAVSGSLVIDALEMPEVTISGFAAGDTINLRGIGADGTVTVSDLTTGLFTIIGSLGSAILKFAGSDDLNLITKPDGAGGTNLVTACYRRGTMILTTTGEVPIEELAIGDQVVTLTGQARPIRWIGQRAYSGRFIAGNRAVLPICLKQDAIAEGIPARDLWLSPEHSLYIDHVLVQAKHLVNDVTIVQADDIDQVEYFHIELDDHDVIYADGIPSETYVDCDNRLMFANGAEYEQLYPDDDRPRWQFCAPRLEWGSAELTSIRQRVFGRVKQLERVPNGRHDFYVIADGAIIAPVTTTRAVHRFDIAAGSTSLWLASDSFVPARRTAGSLDTRRLGIAVERIILSNTHLNIEAWHGHPALSEGFYEDEGTHRWTNGLARLPDVLLRPFSGRFTLDIYLAEDRGASPVSFDVPQLEDALSS